MIYNLSRGFSAIYHIIYGILALIHPYYIEEFTRYGFSKQRVLIATLQLTAGLGMLLGFYESKATLPSAAILALMMTGALGTRIFIQDDLVSSLPAFAYMFINSFIFMKSIKVRK